MALAWEVVRAVLLEDLLDPERALEKVQTRVQELEPCLVKEKVEVKAHLKVKGLVMATVRERAAARGEHLAHSWARH